MPVPPTTPGARAERRVPSGGRPAPPRSVSTKVAHVVASPPSLTTHSSMMSANLQPSRDTSTTSLDRLLSELEAEVTSSPETSPALNKDPEMSELHTNPSTFHARSETEPTQRPASRKALGLGITITSPTPSEPQMISHSSLGPNSPRKPKPKMTLLTTNLPVPKETNKSSPVSPGPRHWTHVRAQVLGDQTPSDSSNAAKVTPAPKKQGLVSKAAGRFGFRQAAENVLGYGPELGDLVGYNNTGASISAEQDEIARERRRFSRDIKASLDSCGREETRRRLQKLKMGAQIEQNGSSKRQSSLPLRSTNPTTRSYGSVQELPPFAPLLTVLHSYVSAARAHRAWAFTLPWHSEVLTELGSAFLNDTADSGGYLMAVEIFGVVVRTWAPARGEEELDRWLWVCKALQVDSKPLRSRAQQLLAELLDRSSALPRRSTPPTTPLALESLFFALLEVAFSTQDDAQLSQRIWMYIEELQAGTLVPLSKREICETYNVEHGNGDSTALVEREVLWNAVLKWLRCVDRVKIAWLVGPLMTGLKRFEPPPILHATPPLVVAIRRQATAAHLDVLPTLCQLDVVKLPTILKLIQSNIFGEIQHFEELASGIQGRSVDLRSKCCRMLLILTAWSLEECPNKEVDPFDTIYEEEAEAVTPLSVLAEIMTINHWRRSATEAFEYFLESHPFSSVYPVVQALLEQQSAAFQVSLMPGLVVLWSRIVVEPPRDLRRAVLFLEALQLAHPNVLYKPLFTCAASSKATVVKEQLGIIQALAQLIGPIKFWTHAHPDMLVLACMGDVAQRQGPNAIGPKPWIVDKLGQNVVLLELVHALNVILREKPESIGDGTRLGKFSSLLESRVFLMLKAQEELAWLSFNTRSLVAQLFLVLRRISLSRKAPPWLIPMASWVEQSAKMERNPEIIAEDVMRGSALDRSVSRTEALQDLYTTPTLSRPSRPAASTGSALQLPHYPSMRNWTADKSTSRLTIINSTALEASENALVYFHPFVTTSSALQVLQVVWSEGILNDSANKTARSLFLLLLAFERSPRDVMNKIWLSLNCQRNHRNSQHKLTCLIALRHQILSSVWLREQDKRSALRFPQPDLSFVPTELGSSTWLAPAAEQDADLLKFGRVLPIDVRQRLLDLGWSEDSAVVRSSDWERVPVTLLPPQHLEPSQREAASSSSSPSQTLLRRRSSADGRSTTPIKRRAILPFEALRMIVDHSKLAAHQDDYIARTEWLGLLSVLTRDDSAGLNRAITYGLGSPDDSASLQSLKMMISVGHRLPPGLAYFTFNSLLGFLKTQVRPSSTTKLWHYSAHMTLLSSIASYLCNFSTREIKKNKSEAFLLPLAPVELADIDEAHWERFLFTRTAQQDLLHNLLASNPREVYLVKGGALKAFPRMLFERDVPSSRSQMALLTVARSWLLLVNQIFASLNRNYNDRSELEGYLQSVCDILTTYGVTDALLTAHCMRIFLLASTKFRRLCSASGMFARILQPTFIVYERAFTHHSIRDCIEYAARGFLSIHMDTFVYQLSACVVPLVVQSSNPAATGDRFFDLLSCLGCRNNPGCGIVSGIKGLNDSQERDALIAMVNDRPEVDLADIRTAADERYARKLNALAADIYEASTFSSEDVVRLFTTVIAADSTSRRAQDFMDCLSVITPHLVRSSSSCRDLLHDAVDALADIYGKSALKSALELPKPKIPWSASVDINEAEERSDECSSLSSLRFHFLRLVQAFLASTTIWSRKILEKAIEGFPELLQARPDAAPELVEATLRAATKARLESPESGIKGAVGHLSDIGPFFGRYLAKMDLSGILHSISVFLTTLEAHQDPQLGRVVVDLYLAPCVEVIANAHDRGIIVEDRLRSAIVEVFCEAIFCTSDPMALLEGRPASLGIMGVLLLPLAQALPSVEAKLRAGGPVLNAGWEAVVARTWVRILSYAVRATASSSLLLPSRVRQSGSPGIEELQRASSILLPLQLVKLALVSAEGAISAVPGIWAHLAGIIKRCTTGASTRFIESAHTPGEVVQQTRVNDWAMWSTSQLLIQFKTPLFIELRSYISLALLDNPGDNSWSRPSTPGNSPGLRDPFSRSSITGGRSRKASNVTFQNANFRDQPRPSFSDLSMRRPSRMTPRFPDTTPTNRTIAHGAIVHLMTAPVRGAPAVITPARDHVEGVAALTIPLKDARLAVSASAAVHSVRAAFGYEEACEKFVAWSKIDAMMVVLQETQILMDEFRDLF